MHLNHVSTWQAVYHNGIKIYPVKDVFRIPACPTINIWIRYFIIKRRTAGCWVPLRSGWSLSIKHLPSVPIQAGLTHGSGATNFEMNWASTILNHLSASLDRSVYANKTSASSSFGNNLTFDFQCFDCPSASI